MTDSSHPHDALFKKTFSVPEHAAAVLRAILPPALVALTDFSTLSLCPGSYVDEALASSASDLLFSVQIAGKPARIYLLFEHQSNPPRTMPLRLLAYIVRILQQHVDDAQAAKVDALPLPLVIPVVLHHGPRGWTTARRLEDLFDPELVQAAGVGDAIPRLGFFLDDLTFVSDAQLEARALGLLPMLTLWALRDARSPERIARSIRHWSNALAALLTAPNGLEALRTIFRYIAVVADDSVITTLAEVLETAQPQVKDTFMTIAEKLFSDGQAKGKAEGRIEGKAEGRIEGKAEGRIEGKADMLRKLLTLKFGTIADGAAATIAAATEAELERWLERVLNAATVDDVLNS